jgi:predicted O-methyltransferase YrrM
MTVLQTIALPLGYSAIRMARGCSDKSEHRWVSILGFEFREIASAVASRFSGV